MKDLGRALEAEKQKTRRIAIADAENRAMRLEVAGLERRSTAATALFLKSLKAVNEDL